MKTGYKQTEIGVIPEDWEVKNLNEICKPSSTRINPLTANEDKKCVELEHLEQATGKLIGFADLKGLKSQKAIFEKNDVLFSKLRPYLRKFLFAEFNGACTTEIWVLKAEKEIESKWLYYLIQSDRIVEAANQSTGTKMPRAEWKTVGNTQISLPKKQEQTAIAAALSDVDALMGELDKLIAKKRDIKQATMQQLLTGKKRLAGFSGEWEVKRLGELATLSKIGLNPANTPAATFVHFSLPAFDDGATPVIENGSSIASNKFVVPQNSVLVSKLNPRIPRIWKPLTIPDNSICSTEFLVLLPSELLIDRDFFTVICSSKSVCAQMELHAIGTTGSHQRIQPQQFLKIKVKIPLEQKEQTAIATILSDMDAQINALQQKRDKTAQLKQGMMQELLTGRIRLIGGNA